MSSVKRHVWFICLILILCMYPVNANAAESEGDGYVVTVYNDRNGLPTGEANTIIQTQDGYIWIGSYGGLIRYDGTKFRNYSLEGQITSSSIRALFEDSKGRLWIGTNDQGVVCLENDVFTEISSPEDFSFLCIRDFTETSDGTIYVASNSGVAAVSDNQLLPIVDRFVNGNTVYNVKADRYDRLWVALDSGRIGVIHDGMVDSIMESDVFFDEEEIYSLACYDKYLYLGTNGNVLARIDISQETLDISKLPTKCYTTGTVTTHNRIDITKAGDVLVSGLTGHYTLRADGNVTKFDSEQNATSVNCSIMDYEGNLWLASSSTGVIRYSKGYFTTPNAVAGLEDLSLNTICKSGNNYYIGTDDGVIVCNNKWEQIHNQLTSELEGVRIRFILADSKNQIWFATYAGVYCYDPATNELQNYTLEQGLLNDRTRTLLELSDGRIAVGTQAGVNIIKNGIITESFDIDDGLVNPAILCMYESADGTLYAGSDGDGVYAIKDGKITNHGFNEGLSEGVILRIVANADDDGFFVSAGSSLYYWKDNAFHKLTNWDKAAGSVFDMYDRDGKLWIMQNKGVLSVDKGALLSGATASTISYSFQHGLTGSLNANTWNYLSDDGKLYMVTRNGVSIFAFEDIHNSEPKAIVNSVVVDDVTYEHPNELKLDDNVNRITFNFAELSYSGTSTLLMSYQLVNFDKEEILFGVNSSGSVSYTNLPGGNYTFVFRIYDPKDMENQKVYQVAIHKDKRLTEYTLFWVGIGVLILLCVAGVILLFYRRKLARMQEFQDEYKDIIEQSLQTFARTIDAKDTYTNGHSIRVAQYSREIAKKLGLSEKEQERIYYLAMLHDIGKIGIPDSILTKPGKLTDEERAIIQTHPAIGGEILKDFTALDGIAEGAKYHHERYDGNGYGEGITGEDIPLVARIIGVADTYDAMSSDRCYRKALSRETILKELRDGKNTQFDPEIVEVMLQLLEEGFGADNQ